MTIPIVHVLIVDDDEDILNLLSLYLEKAGLEVDTAGNGREAIRKLEVCVPELIIADVMMPEMDGYELCRHIRKLGYDSIPFFFCSSLKSIPERIKGLTMGADDYIPKPVNPHELVLKVQVQLEKKIKLRELAQRSKTMADSHMISGDLADMKPFELLQMLHQFGPQDFLARFDPPEGESAEVHVSDREVVHARLEQFEGEKAFDRILRWTEGRYSVVSTPFPGESTLSGLLESKVLEALIHLDEYDMLLSSMLEHGRYFFVDYGDTLFTHRLGDKLLRVLKIVETHQDLYRILDESPYLDHETLRVLSNLMRMGLLGISKTPPIE